MVPVRPRDDRPLAGIQILRGLAALLVALYHIALSMEQWFHVQPFGGALLAGNIGIDLFFVISGFVMLHVHGHEFGNRHAIRPFLLKRAVRIFPLYWFVLALTLLVMRVLGLPLPWSKLPAEILLVLPLSVPVVGVAWTLSYELIFYAVFALLLALRRHLALAALFLWGLAGALTSWNSGWMALTPWVSEFCAGALLAAWISDRRPVPGWIFDAGILVFLAIVASARAPAEHLQGLHRAGLILAAVALVALSVLGARHASGWAARAMGKLGDASYSLYLTHHLAIYCVYTLLQYFDAFGRLEPYLFNFGLLLPALAICALICHRIVERPLLSWGRRLLLR